LTEEAVRRGWNERSIIHGRDTESWGRLPSLPGFEMQIMAGVKKLSQNYGPPNLSGTARFEKRSDPGWFTNRPYGWSAEILGFETVSESLPHKKTPHLGRPKACLNVIIQRYRVTHS